MPKGKVYPGRPGYWPDCPVLSFANSSHPGLRMFWRRQVIFPRYPLPREFCPFGKTRPGRMGFWVWLGGCAPETLCPRSFALWQNSPRAYGILGAVRRMCPGSFLLQRALPRNGKHNPHLGQQHDQRGAAVRKKGQRDAGVGNGVGDHRNIQQRLQPHLRG